MDVATGVGQTLPDTPVAAPASWTRWLRRPLVAGLVLVAVYVVLSFAMDSAGFLGTDTGGKVATVKVMSERGDFDPDIGYWASQWDPEGRVHGLYYTSKVGDRYINVTSLPMVLAARPLYDVGGYRATLLLPMPAPWRGGLRGPCAVAAVATVAATTAGSRSGSSGWRHRSRSTHSTCGSTRSGWRFMAWAVIALFDAVFDRPTWWRGLLAGLGIRCRRGHADRDVRVRVDLDGSGLCGARCSRGGARSSVRW